MSEKFCHLITSQMSCDVVVVGGGTTGIAAALAAARGGASVVLVEKDGFVGGNATAVCSWMGFHAVTGEQVVGGIAEALVDAIRAHGGATPSYPDPICGSLTVVDPSWLKIVSLELLRDAGVRVLLHCRAAGVAQKEHQLSAVYLSAGGEWIKLEAKYVIDCTDSGFVIDAAGELCRRGRQSDGKVQVSSCVFEIGEVDFAQTFAYWQEFPDDIRPFPLADPAAHLETIRHREAFVIGAFGRLIKQARADHLELWRNSVPGIACPSRRKFITVVTRIENVDLLNGASAAAAEMEGMLQIPRWLQFFQKYVPGFQDCRIGQIFPNIGVRESLHLEGCYELTADDVLNGVMFDDAIALGAYHLDIHSPDHGGIETRMPEIYSIPYRSLVPRHTRNLLVAGRMISATHEAQASTRVIPISMAIGEAAGEAAALAAACGQACQQIDVNQLRARLKAHRAILERSARRRR